MNKLGWINSEYIKSADEDELLELVKQSTAAPENKINLSGFTDEYILNVITLMKQRLETINELFDYGDYFFIEPASYDAKGLEKYWNIEIKPFFAEYSVILQENADWNEVTLEKELRDFAEKKNIKAAAIIHLLRLSFTGKTVSPGIFEVMAILGKKTVILRINNFLHKN